MANASRAFRFGADVFGRPETQALQGWRDLARKVEDLGYATFLLPDHLPFLPAPISALTAAAEATTSLRVSAYVFDNMLRHPAVLASELATLDALSRGRLEIGLGAGSPRAGEFEALGLTADAPGVRVRKLEETLRILKGYFSGEPFSFAGQHYTINNLTGAPKVVQRPHPPIHLAAGQERMLGLAACQADIVTLHPPLRVGTQGRPDVSALRSITGEVVEQQLARLRELAGERFAELELCTQLRRLTITDGPAREAIPVSAQRVDQQIPGIFAPLAGSVEQICEQLYANRERFGFSYIVVMSENLEAFAPVIARLAGK